MSDEKDSPLMEAIAGLVAGAAIIMGFMALTAMLRSCVEAWSNLP